MRFNESAKQTKSSGGPSSASSPDCSSPILLRSHTCRRLSVPLDAKMVSLCGDHCTCNKKEQFFTFLISFTNNRLLSATNDHHDSVYRYIKSKQHA